MKRGSTRSGFFTDNLAAIILFAVILAAVLYGLGGARDTLDSEGLRLAELSVRRAAVTCYAIEGRYPESYEYIKENYGVGVDDSKYIVHYEIFASNIMPEVTVTARLQ